MIRIQTLLNSVNIFLFLVTFMLISLGSIGVFTELFVLSGAVCFTVILGYKLLLNGKIEFPKNYFLYVIFLFSLLIHTYFSKGEFIFFWIFLSGGVLWLEVYNFRDVFSQYFISMLVILGVLMGILYFYSLVKPIVLPNLVSLFAGKTELIKHSNLGDLWAVVLIPILYKLIKNKSKKYIPILIIGMYFLIISYSRAAIVSLLVGVFYLFRKDFLIRKQKNILIMFAVGLMLLFMYFGTSKTTILSRPYFFQAVHGLIQYPLGTGLGNFALISHDSNLVHNIFLEILSGMGIFSIFFFVWIYKVIKNIILSKQVNDVAVAIFLAVLTDFCFNTTYTIAGIVWLWFLTLGTEESTTR